MSEDAQLLRRYLGEKSEAAFAELVRRHISLVYSVALRQVAGDAHLAEDVVQQVFTALARKAGTLAGRPTLTGWLYRSTHFVASDVVRSERRRRAREQEAHAMQEIHASTAAGPDWEKVRPAIDAAIAELDERDRDAVALRFFDGCSWAEVGGRLRLTENAARMRVERALDKLHAALARRGVTSSVAALGIALGNSAVVAVPESVVVAVTGSAFASVSAGGVLATAGTVFHFMNASKLVGGAVAFAAFLTIGAAVREHVASADARAAWSAAVRERDALHAKLQAVQQHANRAEQNLRALAPSVGAAPAAPPAEPSAVDQVAAGLAFLEANPDLKRVFVDSARSRVAARYQVLYQRLRLSPAQIQQFEELMQGRDDSVTVDFEGLPRMRFAVTPEAGEGLPNQRLWELLGEAGFQQFEEIRHPDGAHRMTLRLAGALQFTTPLTADQAAQMNRILAAGRQGTQTNWELVLTQASAVLAEPQLALLRGFQAQEESRRAVNEAKRRVPASGKS